MSPPTILYKVILTMRKKKPKPSKSMAGEDRSLLGYLGIAAIIMGRENKVDSKIAMRVHTKLQKMDRTIRDASKLPTAKNCALFNKDIEPATLGNTF